MKKILTLIIMFFTIALTGCSSEAERTLIGTAQFDWHVPIHTFDVTVHVTLKGDKITNVRLNEASYFETGDYDEWCNGQEIYLEQYVGLTVSQVLDFEIVGEATDKIYVGHLVGDVYVVTGATASSLAVAKAIMNAMTKY